ncbi:hypothetical protein TCAL_15490, partial [Tigriopus californicus]
MISNKQILILGLLVILATCWVYGEPEPRRRSKVPKIFNGSEEGNIHTSNSREGKAASRSFLMKSEFLPSCFRFGVCCVFLVSTSGATVTQNCSYVRNSNFPSPLDSTSQISYNIQKCDQSNPNGNGCLQYHTGLTGRLTTFNFLPTNDNHLANQDYSVCIRQEAGFCCIEYSVCSDANSFSIDTNMMLMMSKVETECLTIDYITIE